MERNVKGTLFIEFVKTIRADQKGTYDRFFNAEDRQVFDRRIIPSGWYPFETYKKCFRAVLQQTGGGNLEVARQWGRQFGREIMTSFYQGVHRKHAPCDTLKRYRTIFPLFYTFGSVTVDCPTDRLATLTVHDFDPDFMELYYLFSGWIEQSLDFIGARNIRITIEQRSENDKPVTVLSISYLPIELPTEE